MKSVDLLFDRQFFDYVVYGIFAAAPIMLLVEKVIKVPMGKQVRDGWGPMVNYRVGWLLMEFMASIGFFLMFICGKNVSNPVSVFLLCLWMAHYAERTFVYPFRVRGGKPINLLVATSGCLYQSVNSYVNAFWIGHFSGYDLGWLTDPRFLLGTAVFIAGFYVNRQSDQILRNLRKPGETGYKIPEGGLFNYVSCPHYFGEMVMWTGWAIATWSLAGLSFAIFTATNIGTRAITAHHWYVEKFGESYPKRKALIPGLF